MYLSGEEHHHLSRVVRIKSQEKVWLFDGLGMSYMARVEEIGPEKTRLVVLKTIAAEEPRVKIVLGQAVLKAKKMEMILQKTTELGISEFLPVVTERTIVKIQQKERQRQDRWQRIIREAAKQSRRTVFPTIQTPSSLSEVVSRRNDERMLFFSEHQGTPLKDILLFKSPQSEDKIPASVIILIGPEGGWTHEEEKIMLSHEYEAVSLGQAVLRAETTAVSAVAMISHFWLD